MTKNGREAETSSHTPGSSREGEHTPYWTIVQYTGVQSQEVLLLEYRIPSRVVAGFARIQRIAACRAELLRIRLLQHSRPETTVTRSASEVCKSRPRLRFGLVWDVSNLTGSDIPQAVLSPQRTESANPAGSVCRYRQSGKIADIHGYE